MGGAVPLCAVTTDCPAGLVCRMGGGGGGGALGCRAPLVMTEAGASTDASGGPDATGAPDAAGLADTGGGGG